MKRNSVKTVILLICFPVCLFLIVFSIFAVISNLTVNPVQKAEVKNSMSSWLEGQENLSSLADSNLEYFHANRIIINREHNAHNYDNDTDWDMVYHTTESDKANFTAWNRYLSNLSDSQDHFSTATDELPAIDYYVINHNKGMIKKMGEYQADMERTQKSYVLFCDYIVAYYDSIREGKSNDTFRVKANSALEDAEASYKDAGKHAGTVRFLASQLNILIL